MRGLKFLTAISIVLFLCINTLLFVQEKDQTSQHRGVRLVAKDNRSGEEGVVNLYNKVYGVIIGIDLYENLSPGEQLRYAVKDAKGIEKMLRERFVFDEIFTLYNSEATREAIMSLFLSKLSHTNADDAVFIFFAGHGHTDTTQYGELGYLVPYEGSFEKNKLYKNISMIQLKDEVSKQIRAKHVLFMVDACYSGLLVTRGRSHESSRDLSYIRSITEEPVRQVLTAGGKGEKVLDGGPYGHSVFVGRILQILKDTSDYITAKELYIQLREKVFSDARARNHTQTPDFGTLFGLGDFVFVPRVDKQYEEVHAEVLKLQSRLSELDRQMQELAKIKSKKEMREAVRKAEDVKAKLKAKQIEEERLLKEKERKSWMEQEEKRLAQEESEKKAERERRKVAEEERLKRLRLKITDEEAKLKDIKQEVLSIEVARKEVKKLESIIDNIVSLVSQEKEKALKQLEEDYDLLIEKLQNKSITPKDQFESTADYEARVKKHQEKIRDIKKAYGHEYVEIQNKYYNEIKTATKAYKEQKKEIENRKYPLEGLNLELLNYNADRESYSVKLNDASGKIWYYLLSVKPDIARGFFERKELLKAEGYYVGLNSINRQPNEVFLIDPISGSLQLLPPKITLRSYYMSRSPLKYNDAISMIKQKGFFDLKNNPEGDFNNEFVTVRINEDVVVLDFATGLMWHQSGLPRFKKTFFESLWRTDGGGSAKITHNDINGSVNRRVLKRLKKLNETGYAGYKDWRYPNLEEAASLLDRGSSDSNLYIDKVFSSEQWCIWTGDGENLDKGKLVIWIVDFRKGTIGLFHFNRENKIYPYLRPVRFIQ